jgi:hypothetical protein
MVTGTIQLAILFSPVFCGKQTWQLKIHENSMEMKDK